MGVWWLCGSLWGRCWTLLVFTTTPVHINRAAWRPIRVMIMIFLQNSHNIKYLANHYYSSGGGGNRLFLELLASSNSCVPPFIKAQSRARAVTRHCWHSVYLHKSTLTLGCDDTRLLLKELSSGFGHIVQVFPLNF